MQKIIKVFNAISLILPFLLQIVDFYKKNKKVLENLVKKPTSDIEIPDEAAEPIEKKK